MPPSVIVTMPFSRNFELCGIWDLHVCGGVCQQAVGDYCVSGQMSRKQRSMLLWRMSSFISISCITTWGVAFRPQRVSLASVFSTRKFLKNTGPRPLMMYSALTRGSRRQSSTIISMLTSFLSALRWEIFERVITLES